MENNKKIVSCTFKPKDGYCNIPAFYNDKGFLSKESEKRVFCEIHRFTAGNDVFDRSKPRCTVFVNESGKRCNIQVSIKTPSGREKTTPFILCAKHTREKNSSHSNWSRFKSKCTSIHKYRPRDLISVNPEVPRLDSVSVSDYEYDSDCSSQTSLRSILSQRTPMAEQELVSDLSPMSVIVEEPKTPDPSPDLDRIHHTPNDNTGFYSEINAVIDREVKKRKRELCDDYERENKRLKTEKEVLKSESQKLKSEKEEIQKKHVSIVSELQKEIHELKSETQNLKTESDRLKESSERREFAIKKLLESL